MLLLPARDIYQFSVINGGYLLDDNASNSKCPCGDMERWFWFCCISASRSAVGRMQLGDEPQGCLNVHYQYSGRVCLRIHALIYSDACGLRLWLPWMVARDLWSSHRGCASREAHDTYYPPRYISLLSTHNWPMSGAREADIFRYKMSTWGRTWGGVNGGNALETHFGRGYKRV